jgi:TRAP-type C4-dicarboxylate transport system substrate-binding protein
MMARMVGLPALAVAIASGLATSGTAARAQDLPKHAFRVVGTWSNLTNYQVNERPFWSKTLPEASKGQLTASIRSISEFGLRGTEVVRLLQLGLFDFAQALPTYVAEDAVVEGIDIAGVAKSFDMARNIVDAYAPVLNAAVEKRYRAHVLNYYTWPSQMFYCNAPIKGLADIKGKKVRVQGTSQGDLVEALGGTSVNIPFGEVVPALQRGTVDCGITGTMPAYKAGWHEVTSHVLRLPVGFSVSFTVVSLATWGKLDDKTKAFMESSVKGQTDKWWKTIIDEDTMGLNCTTGTGECSVGKPGKLVKVEPAAADTAILEAAMKDVVLKRWAKRCGSDASCISNWNDTIGKVVGLTATQ